VGAKLCKAAVFDNGDSIGIFQRPKPVGDDDGGAVLRDVEQRLLQPGFCIGVYVGGGLVENQDRRIY